MMGRTQAQDYADEHGGEVQDVYNNPPVLRAACSCSSALQQPVLRTEPSQDNPTANFKTEHRGLGE